MRRLAILMLMTLPLFAGGVFAQQKAGKDTVYEELNLFDQAFERIRQDAVDPVSDAKLIGSAIAGMLSGLDPHASFMDDAALKASQTPANDDAGTLGLAVTIQNGQLQVISPEDGSPAARAGIRPGDAIFTIDKEPVYDLTLSEVEQKLRGPVGSEVRLVLRRGTEKPFDLSLKREAHKLETVVGRVESGNVGYLRIAGFDGGTQAALAAAVQDLRQKIGSKLVGFILDLRNNPGGGFDAAVAVADAFIDKGDIVVVKGRKPATIKRIAATPGDLAKGLPLVGLITRGRVRRRRAAGQPPGGAAGQQDFWRKLDRERDPVGGGRRDSFDHRPLYDAVGAGDSGKGSRSRPRRHLSQARPTGAGPDAA